MNEQIPFVLKYAPTSLDSVVLDENLRNTFKEFIKAPSSFPNLLLSGKQGIGKSTIAKILIRDLAADYLFINGSLENGVDVVKNKINQFVNTCSMDNKLKIVYIDEADTLTKEANGSSAQEAMRNIIDKSMDDTRFILTCNYENKIAAPLKSRCTKIDIIFSKEDLLRRIIEIIKSEKINFTKETISKFYSSVLIPNFPDIRHIINTLQILTVDGTLNIINGLSSTKLDEFISSLVKMISDRNSLSRIREFYCKNSEIFLSDFELLGGKIFDYLMNKIEYSEHSGKIFIIIAESLFRMSQVQTNKEIQFAGMVQELTYELPNNTLNDQ